MIHLLKPFDEIITGRLQPWLSRNILPEGKYKELNAAFQKELYTFQPKWQVAFTKPITPIRTYYNNIICNASVYFLNSIVKNVNATKIENEQHYWVSTKGVNALLKRLKDINELIELKGYHWHAFQGPSIGSDAGKPARDQAYIIQLLKYHLIHLYLELVDAYPALVKPENKLIAEEVYREFFQEPPQPFILVDAEKLQLQQPASIREGILIKPEFSFIGTDFRKEQRLALKFDVVVGNVHQLRRFEASLYDKDLINSEYKFDDSHGNIQLMAAAYHVAIKMGCFRPINFNTKAAITDNQIRRFLNHRYNATIRREFTNWKNDDPTPLSKLINHTHWLDQLLSK